MRHKNHLLRASTRQRPRMHVVHKLGVQDTVALHYKRLNLFFPGKQHKIETEFVTTKQRNMVLEEELTQVQKRLSKAEK